MAALEPTNVYPLPKFHFKVSWQGASMSFTEVSGLDFETEVIEYRSGDNYNYAKTQQPGLTKWNKVTFKRGTFLGDFDFFELWKKTYYFQEQTAKYRATVTVQLLDETHSTIITWAMANAWANKITATDLKADANEVAIESMEMVHEGLTIVQAP